MVLDPVHGKVDKFALAHKADCPVAERRYGALTLQMIRFSMLPRNLFST